MVKKLNLAIVVAVVVALVHPAGAQQPKKVHRVGFLCPQSQPTPQQRVMERGLRELGHVEGKNLVIESRFAKQRLERFPDLAAELVRLKVDVIVTTAGPPSLAAKQATTTIPVVFTQVPDPVADGLVASLARPGGNITGLSQIGPELAGKRLELLKEAFPKISRVAILRTAGSRSAVARFKETQVGAKAMGVQLHSLEVGSSDDLEGAFRAATTGRAGALIVFQSALINTHRTRIVEFAAKSRLPSIFGETRFVDAGGLAAYAEDRSYNFRRAAFYVDKILKGAKPVDLPVQQATKFEFIINLKAAKQIGLTLSPELLARANKVIQ